MHAECATTPEFISEFFRRFPSVNFLLDLAHARVTAAAFRTDLAYYLKNLPLDRVRHIHISRPTWVVRPGKDRLQLWDSHEAPKETELAFLDLALKMGAKPEYLTVEYYRNEDQMIESYLALQSFFRSSGYPPYTRNLALLDHGFRTAEQRITELPGYDREQLARDLPGTSDPAAAGDF